MARKRKRPVKKAPPKKAPPPAPRPAPPQPPPHRTNKPAPPAKHKAPAEHAASQRKQPTHKPAKTTQKNRPRARPIASAASGYDSDQNTNIDIVLTVGIDKKAPRLAILGALCAGSGENNWHTQGCNGYSGCGPCGHGCCGFWQINCAWQAKHAYTDVKYWTEYAYDYGFYGHGGLIAIAERDPSLSPGWVAQYCQGAGPTDSVAAAYYDGKAGEAVSLLDSRVPGYKSGGGVVQTYNPGPQSQQPLPDATAWLGPITAIDAAGSIDNAWAYLAQGASAARGGGKALLRYVLSQITIDPSG